MFTLVYMATSWTDLTILFVSWYPVVFFLPHFLFPFHHYLCNWYTCNLKEPTRHPYIDLLIIIFTISEFPVNRTFQIIQCQISRLLLYTVSPCINLTQILKTTSNNVTVFWHHPGIMDSDYLALQKNFKLASENNNIINVTVFRAAMPCSLYCLHLQRLQWWRQKIPPYYTVSHPRRQ
jgi:hypothetical protein